MNLHRPKETQIPKPGKKRKKRPAAKKTIKHLDDKLWKLFSKFIRMRDANDNGIVLCITCGTPRFWKNCDAGHFIGRQHKRVKFHEWNVNGQCKPCNGWGQGEQAKYEIAINNKFGCGTSDSLRVIKKLGKIPNRIWYEVMISVYEKKVKEQEKRVAQEF